MAPCFPIQAPVVTSSSMVRTANARRHWRLGVWILSQTLSHSLLISLYLNTNHQGFRVPVARFCSVFCHACLFVSQIIFCVFIFFFLKNSWSDLETEEQNERKKVEMTSCTTIVMMSANRYYCFTVINISLEWQAESILQRSGNTNSCFWSNILIVSALFFYLWQISSLSLQKL